MNEFSLFIYFSINFDILCSLTRYVVYGPLANAATSVMFEGTPFFPDNDRYWQIVEKYKVNQLYTAPTAIRALMKYGDEPVLSHDLSSLR